MYFSPPLLTPALPEIVLLGLLCIVLLSDVLVPARLRVVTFVLAQASLLLTALCVLATRTEQPKLTFGDSFVNDELAVVFKLFILLVTAVVFF
jgi:NADH-quinone oxidoreductase subunit N